MRPCQIAALLLLALAGCEATPGPGAPPAGTPSAAPAETPLALLPAPDTAAGETRAATGGLRQPPARAPEIYMDVQRNSAGVVSLVFAIDASRDGTPGDDPAIRLTPENGGCNPAEMRRYAFAAEAEPVFGPGAAAAGIGAERLPAFMAVAATDAILARGWARDREDTAPQNICTRKLWERLVRPAPQAGAAAPEG